MSASDLFLGGLEVTCSEPLWQSFFDKVKPEILSTINYGLDFGQGVGLALVDGVNYILENQDENTFVVDVLGMPFNLTMTRYPEFSREKDEVSINIDGEFISDMAKQYVTPDSTWVDFEGQDQAEQLWIHQSMVNSLLYQVKKTLSGTGFNE